MLSASYYLVSAPIVSSSGALRSFCDDRRYPVVESHSLKTLDKACNQILAENSMSDNLNYDGETTCEILTDLKHQNSYNIFNSYNRMVWKAKGIKYRSARTGDLNGDSGIVV